ncbi:hypothetical protein [Actinomadura sp. CNU-125]|uniref:hypothetical protein n=1 Tax=Actinomadura sp. CNU-125 TaxID=1904961 RepID=UPI001300E0C7|nr:hypothetical protein [Actinomadura sp. CNU-125]
MERRAGDHPPARELPGPRRLGVDVDQDQVDPAAVQPRHPREQMQDVRPGAAGVGDDAAAAQHGPSDPPHVRGVDQRGAQHPGQRAQPPGPPVARLPGVDHQDVARGHRRDLVAAQAVEPVQQRALSGAGQTGDEHEGTGRVVQRRPRIHLVDVVDVALLAAGSVVGETNTPRRLFRTGRRRSRADDRVRRTAGRTAGGSGP